MLHHLTHDQRVLNLLLSSYVPACVPVCVCVSGREQSTQVEKLGDMGNLTDFVKSERNIM